METKTKTKRGRKPNQKKYVYVVQDFMGNINGCFSTEPKADKFMKTMGSPLWVQRFELY